MKRRDFVTGAAAVAAGAISLPPLGWAQEKSKLKITGMVGQKLIRMEIKGRQIVSQETLIQDYGRVRDIEVGPDGNIYLLLQNMNGDPKGGSIVRLVPAN